MADRYRAASGWSVEVVQRSGTPDNRDGQQLRVRHHEFYVADVRTVAELEQWFPLADLEPDGLSLAAPRRPASIAGLLDREESERSRPLGRALDLGCGRGQGTPELARRGWQAVSVDYVPVAIEAAAAKSRDMNGLSYAVGDVTRLPSAHLGMFDFFLGCFQGLDAGQRLSQGQGISALANPAATVLLLSFGPSRWRRLVGGASQEEVQAAFAGWQMLTVELADTASLGWPMNKTAPRWYRLRRQA